MEHIYPAFERGRIMKKELLESLREYSYSAMEIKYQDYSEGIITGCQLGVEDDFIIISPGIIKCEGFLFILGKEERVRYQASEKYVRLKFRIVKKEELPDYTRYETEYILDEDLQRKAGEIEIARFKLKQGSKLRCAYKDFEDIQTEFDTLNLLDATWAGRGGETVPVPVMRCFAEEVMKRDSAGEVDRCFAWQCLENDGKIELLIIINYVCLRQGMLFKDIGDKNNIYHQLSLILNQILDGRSKRRYIREKRILIVD